MKTASSPQIKKLALAGLLLITANCSFADTADPSTMPADVKKIKEYFHNLGQYFGYDLESYCTTGGSCSESGDNGGGGYSNLLTSTSSAYALSSQMDLITSFLGALLPSVTPNANKDQASFQLVPNTASPYAPAIDSLGNQSFSLQNPSFVSPNSGGFSVSPLVDQTPYQTDPVNQALLNLIATPDVSFCVNSNTKPISLSSPCMMGSGGSTTTGGSSAPVLSQVQIMLNTIGSNAFSSSASASTYPATFAFALPSANASLVAQLNSDTLLGPLMFDNSGNGNGSPQTNNTNAPGLNANNQIEQAANYIRYATGSVSPLTQPSYSKYSKLYAQAIGASQADDPTAQLTAQGIIASYLTNLRVYAAQTSVGISNLYYILSRRMPQKSQTSSNQQTSQALSEYVMATWRLQPPKQTTEGNTTTWTTQINNASSATVQKEIAILLSEINYQLYLSRVMQERLLLTNSTMLLQGSHNTQPSSDLTKAPGAEPADAPGSPN